MKFTPIAGKLDQADLEKDFETAEKVEKWRAGKLAFYQSAGLLPVKYLPLDMISKAYPHDFQVKGGCSCAGTYPTRGVIVGYGEKGILKLIPNKEKNSDRIIDMLKSRISGLDTEIPELYRRETREKY